MTRKKRTYDVLLGVTESKIVQVRAYSAKHARRVIFNDEEVEQLGGIWGTVSVGQEFVIDVVREGEAWHSERRSPVEGQKND